MSWEIKCWGRVRHLFHSEFAAVSHLEMEAGWRCSCHKHEHRANQFNVLSGEVVIEVWDSVFDLEVGEPVYYVLTEGESLIVDIGTWHRFNVLSSGEMIEVYWPEDDIGVRLDDIIRVDVGGEVNLDDLRRRIRYEK